jgi:uncharacterized protein YbbC (DUF1343 family)/CubicO group peptidase (beta-lactamase class C family)
LSPLRDTAGPASPPSALVLDARRNRNPRSVVPESILALLALLALSIAPPPFGVSNSAWAKASLVKAQIPRFPDAIGGPRQVTNIGLSPPPFAYFIGASMTSRTSSPFAGFLPVTLAFALVADAQGESLPFRDEKLREMDAAILEAIRSGQCPGGVLWFEHQGAAYHKAYGFRSLVPSREPMTEDTIFDAASLTKVIACTPAVMLLVERGSLDLDASVSRYIPEFKGGGKESITIRQLLTHTSGLRPDIETSSDWHGQAAAIQKACAEQVQSPPGTVFRYSDINFFLLGEVVQRVSGVHLEDFVSTNLYQPLGMSDTGYLPPRSELARIAPTEVVNGTPWRGIVHDPTARHMGGVAGHAGLFFTTPDLARFARMLLAGGSSPKARIFKPETIRSMTTVQTPPAVRARRGLGWDIDSGYSGPRGKLFPLGSYGHTGWTGTSIWIDPFSQSFLIFLSNRNHPSEDGNVGQLRSKLGTLAAEAIPDFNFAFVPGSLPPRTESEPAVSANSATSGARTNHEVLAGIDVLVKQQFAPLKGLRVGLVTNHSGQDRNRNPTIDLLLQATNLQLTALFSPEHGIRGIEDEAVADSVDAKSGLPVYSLYGENRRPTRAQLKDLDALVFDIQDVGCRFYTFTATLGLVIEAASEAGIKCFVLDRPDPINGTTVEGPVLGAPPTFVGFHPVPLRFAMTLGELAQMFNADHTNHAELSIIRLENWHRDLWFDETALPWTNPSPNMRTLPEAILYPGVGLLERAVSVGRGTDTPFEIVGAPYVDDLKLARELNHAGLTGVRFVPVRFTPTASVHHGELCRGVFVDLVDRERCRPVDVGLELARTLYRLYPQEFPIEKLAPLLLHPATLSALKADKSLAEIHALWEPELAEFQKHRAQFLLYP